MYKRKKEKKIILHTWNIYQKKSLMLELILFGHVQAVAKKFWACILSCTVPPPHKVMPMQNLRMRPYLETGSL